MPYRVDTNGIPIFPLTPATGVEAVGVRLDTRLRTLLREWPSDVSVGIDWLALLEGGALDREALEAEVRAQCEADPAVVSVDGVTVTQAGTAVSVVTSLTVSLEGTTSALLLTVGPDPYATRAAPPWYLASGAFRYTRGAFFGG